MEIMVDRRLMLQTGPLGKFKLWLLLLPSMRTLFPFVSFSFDPVSDLLGEHNWGGIGRGQEQEAPCEMNMGVISGVANSGSTDRLFVPILRSKGTKQAEVEKTQKINKNRPVWTLLYSFLSFFECATVFDRDRDCVILYSSEWLPVEMLSVEFKRFVRECNEEDDNHGGKENSDFICFPKLEQYRLTYAKMEKHLEYVSNNA